MSPNRRPTVDLRALRDSLDEPTPRHGDSDAGALAIETAAQGNGPTALSAQRQDGEVPGESPAALPVPRLGAEAAANMTKLSEAAAQDIRQLGKLALEAGKRVQEECEQMALDVEANGGAVALHLTGLSQLLADVGMSNRETLHRLLGAGQQPSIVPSSSGNGQVAEQPVGIGNAERRRH
jgi:hypothetical protein